MSEINVYLRFNGNCREALTFYKECLGGELTMQTMAEAQMGGDAPADAQDQIIHGTLRSDGMVLMASDMLGPKGLVQGTSMALTLNCSSPGEINHFFSCLSEGGEVVHPLKTEFWGGTFGILNDKYGHEWLLNYEAEPAA